MPTATRARLSRIALLGNLFTSFRRGPSAILLGDVSAQLKRELVDVKRRLGWRLTVADLAKVLAAIHGIESSRRYARGYEYVYEHLKARVSPAAAVRMGHDTFFPPSEALIEFTKTFDETGISHTIACLEQTTRATPAPVAMDDLKTQWDRAMAADGAGRYEHFNRCAWQLIYTVAFRSAGGFVRQAVASIPHVESYICATAEPGLSYFDVLADAPKFLRVLVYSADANRKGHALDGAHIIFPPDASENASRTLDDLLRRVLGDAGARQHVLFSENRDRVEREDPVDVQACLDRALLLGQVDTPPGADSSAIPAAARR